MKIGESVSIYTNNLLVPIVVGKTENGTAIDVAAGLVGEVVGQRVDKKTGYSVCVQIAIGMNKNHKPSSIRVYMQPKSLKVVTQ